MVSPLTFYTTFINACQVVLLKKWSAPVYLVHGVSRTPHCVMVPQTASLTWMRQTSSAQAVSFALCTLLYIHNLFVYVMLRIQSRAYRESGHATPIVIV